MKEMGIIANMANFVCLQKSQEGDFVDPWHVVPFAGYGYSHIYKSSTPLYLHMRTKPVWLMPVPVILYIKYTTFRARVANKHCLPLT